MKIFTFSEKVNFFENYAKVVTFGKNLLTRVGIWFRRFSEKTDWHIPNRRGHETFCPLLIKSPAALLPGVRTRNKKNKRIKKNNNKINSGEGSIRVPSKGLVAEQR